MESLLALKLVYKFEESAQLFKTFKVFITKLNQMKHAFFREFLGDFSHKKWTISDTFKEPFMQRCQHPIYNDAL